MRKEKKVKVEVSTCMPAHRRGCRSVPRVATRGLQFPEVLVKGIWRRPCLRGGNIDEAIMCQSGIRSDKGHGRGAPKRLLRVWICVNRGVTES